MRESVIPLLIVVPLVACSSETPTSSSQPTSSICDEIVKRNQTCESGVRDDAKCKTNTACWRNLYQPSDGDALGACLKNLTCGTSESSCYESVSKKYETDPAVAEYMSSCAARRSTCMNSFGQEWCASTFGMLTTQRRMAESDCLKVECSKARQCFDDVYTAAGCVK